MKKSFIFTTFLVMTLIFSSCGDLLNNSEKDLLLTANDLNGHWETVIVDLSENLSFRTVPSEGFDIDGEWVDEGNSIIFASNRGNNPMQLYYLDLETGEIELFYTGNLSNDDQPSLSPDGSKIAFRSDRTGNVEVYVVERDNTEEIRITEITRASGEDWSPSWSPDGNQLVFASNRNGNFDIFVTNADGSNTKQLTNSPENEWLPTWSPDGKKIAFASNKEGNWDIFLMNPDGSEMTQLTSHPSTDTEPVWSPDSEKIAFASMRSKDDSTSYRIFTITIEDNQTEGTGFAGIPYDWIRK
ncbi:MAG TPA: hypothetical protein DCG23_00420 [Deltaproteobacteria bacterium]|nr:hypothetical protein [Deltaproteobacteria bacterium]|tara:strand:- start:247 stop:1143 length:897 start_codon:yes stop_codon:yes gene_type:complete